MKCNVCGCIVDKPSRAKANVKANVKPLCLRCEIATNVERYCDDGTPLEELREIVADVNGLYDFGFKNIFKLTKPEIKKTIQDFLKAASVLRDPAAAKAQPTATDTSRSIHIKLQPGSVLHLDLSNSLNTNLYIE
jgi:hypothetical protein